MGRSVLVIPLLALLSAAEASPNARGNAPSAANATRPFDEAAVLRAPDGASGDQFGWSVALSGDTLLVEDAILLINEIDGFLANRAGAHRTWEVTQVNELLTLMESFAGVLLATTNRLDALDPASIRRFDMKVAFELPGTEQLEALGRALCARIGVRVPLDGCFERLKGLAAGDFAAVARQAAVLEAPNLRDILSILSQECRLKGGSGRGMGFI